MPEVLFCIMKALIEGGDFLKVEQISAYSGYEIGTIRRAIPVMLGLNWVVRPQPGIYALAERGKMALAIQVGRKSRHGIGAAQVTFRDFETGNTVGPRRHPKYNMVGYPL